MLREIAGDVARKSALVRALELLRDEATRNRLIAEHKSKLQPPVGAELMFEA